jgi:hypothetical protein
MAASDELRQRMIVTLALSLYLYTGIIKDQILAQFQVIPERGRYEYQGPDSGPLRKGLELGPEPQPISIEFLIKSKCFGFMP